MREEYEDTAELAQRTRTSRDYWNKIRVAGEGPPFIKLGRRVLYQPRVVDAWLASMAQRSTSGEPAQQVPRLEEDDTDSAPVDSSAHDEPEP